MNNYYPVIAVVFFLMLPLTVVGMGNSNITNNSVNLTVNEFFESYISKNKVHREKAELYMLGVMDSTEGRTWCSYSMFKTITLRERIFEELKKNYKGDKRRASFVIENILS